GKTLFALEFLVRGAMQFDEPGVFFAFEETPEELARNVASLGFDLDELVRKKKLVIEYVHVDPREISESGEYDLEGLFVRLGAAIDEVRAERVAIDTLETIFSGFTNHALLRAELRRLFRWLKDRKQTVLITGERGDGQLTRQGLEEYVSDCVILLDHRVDAQISTRRLRIVKYRGSRHGTNEYPFLIDEHGISVLPISSLGLNHQASDKRVSTGIPDLDAMMGNRGYYRGSSILVSGTAGIGKTSTAVHFAHATCKRGERCLYFAFEESPHQVIRNMRSIGIDLQPHIRSGNLDFHSVRPTACGLEMHLVAIHKRIQQFKPDVVIVDPISNLISISNTGDVNAMLVRLVDLLKSAGITALFTSLTSAQSASLEGTDVGISSLIDTWLLLRDIEMNGERLRGLYILKSRGMEHSNQIREFRLGRNGIRLTDVYLGREGMLMGSARLAREAEEAAEAAIREQDFKRREAELEVRRKALQAQIAALEAAFKAEESAFRKAEGHERNRLAQINSDRAAMARMRKTTAVQASINGGKH
ncbi:MAG TPA: circadian clock protein KaiC, partial [Planctomycetota bacterium]|nr:circadian clock protein KaiC [Planctomycetota bacterium]